MIKVNLNIKSFSPQGFKGENSENTGKKEVFQNGEKPALGVPICYGIPVKDKPKIKRGCFNNLIDFLTGKTGPIAESAQNKVEKLNSKIKDLETKIKNFFTTDDAPYQHYSQIRDSVKEWLKIRVEDVGGDKYRYEHMKRCEKEAETMANLYGLDPKTVAKAKIGALLHDNSKKLSNDDMLAQAKKYNLDIKAYANKYDPKALDDPSRLHGLVGAAVISDKLGITNPDIYNGIYYHTPGRAEEGNLYNHTNGKEGKYIDPVERLIPMSDKEDHIYSMGTKESFNDSLKYLVRTLKFADGLPVINPDYKT